jgi:Tfp pilus assembly protein PilF
MRGNVISSALIPALIFGAASYAHGSAPERWVEARSTHFVVLSDSSEKAARHVASQFERMHLVFHTLLPTPSDDSGPPIVVVAVKDRKGMQALEPESYLAKNQVDLAGFFLRTTDRNYILVRLDAQEEHAYSTVYHEYTHYMLRKADNWLPLWLNEGLAQFYENTDIDDKAAWLGEANAKELQYLNRNDLLPLKTLLKVDTASPYYHDEEKGSVFYAESWALTHFLIVSDRLQGTHRLHDYSERLAKGEDSVSAAQRAFGDLDKLQAGLNEYLMQRKFMYFMMTADLAAKDAEFRVQPVSTVEADAVRADVLVNTGRRIDARELLDGVLRDDPENALAHETMGFLRYREGDFAGSKRWYGEAVKLDPQSYVAQYYFAMSELRGGDTGEDATIEASLRAAMRLNGEFAPAYDALAMFYAMRDRELDDAHAMNLRAMELEPGRLSFRLDCAAVLVEQRQFADALGVLQAAMHVAKTPMEVEVVRGRIAWVGTYQTATAGARAKERGLGGVGQ